MVVGSFSICSQSPLAGQPIFDLALYRLLLQHADFNFSHARVPWAATEAFGPLTPAGVGESRASGLDHLLDITPDVPNAVIRGLAWAFGEEKGQFILSSNLLIEREYPQ